MTTSKLKSTNRTIWMRCVSSYADIHVRSATGGPHQVRWESDEDGC